MTGMAKAGPIENTDLCSRKDTLCFQIFPDPSDFEHCYKLKDGLPSIVLEPSEGEVESGELRWPPEEMLISEEVSQKVCKETETQVSMEQ